MTDDQILANMRARIAQCRRLAKLLHNPEAVRMLLEMAEQGEADVKKLEGHREEAERKSADTLVVVDRARKKG